MSGNQDIFSSVRLQLEAEDKNRPLSNSASNNTHEMSNSSIVSDKKRKQSFKRSLSTVSTPGHLVLYEDDTTSNMPSLSAHLKSLAGFEVAQAKKQSTGGHGSGVIN